MRTFLTRDDKDVGVGSFDSIAWAFREHVKVPDIAEAKFAVLYGNEDCPSKIVFFKENDFRQAPIYLYFNMDYDEETGMGRF